MHIRLYDEKVIEVYLNLDQKIGNISYLPIMNESFLNEIGLISFDFSGPGISLVKNGNHIFLTIPSQRLDLFLKSYRLTDRNYFKIESSGWIVYFLIGADSEKLKKFFQDTSIYSEENPFVLS